MPFTKTPGCPRQRVSTRSWRTSRANFGAFPDSYEYRVQHIAADGNVVLTERLDMIKGPDGKLHGVPVMGTFVVTDGKISRVDRLLGHGAAGEDDVGRGLFGAGTGLVLMRSGGV